MMSTTEVDDAVSSVEPWARSLMSPVQLASLKMQHDLAGTPVYVLLAPGRSFVMTVPTLDDANDHLHNNEYVISYISSEAIFD